MLLRTLGQPRSLAVYAFTYNMHDDDDHMSAVWHIACVQTVDSGAARHCVGGCRAYHHFALSSTHEQRKQTATT